MAGDDSVFDKGNDGLLEADDSREVLFSLLDARYEVLAHLLLDCLTLPAGFLQFSKVLRLALCLCHR